MSRPNIIVRGSKTDLTFEKGIGYSSAFYTTMQRQGYAQEIRGIKDRFNTVLKYPDFTLLPTKDGQILHYTKKGRF